MNLSERIKARKNQVPKLIICAGRRFGGKSSSLGTLPGKSLIIEITDREAGAEGALAVARELGNDIDLVTGVDCNDVLELAREAIQSYDNVAIDGLSALSEVEASKPDVKKLIGGTGNSVFKGWRQIGESLVNLILELKKLSLEHNKPIIVTLALSEKLDGEGNVASVTPAVKGNMALEVLKGKVKFFVTARKASDKDGNQIHVLQTQDDEVYPSRLDGVLAKDRPKGFRTEPDKIPDGQQAGFAGLIEFLNNYWN